MKNLLNKIEAACKGKSALGKVATYIPELSGANPEDFGICIATCDGKIFDTGMADAEFTVQSIIKPIILLLAIQDSGYERVRSLVGVESTGKPFDSFNYSDLALRGEHINPMINTGAIALCSLIDGKNEDEKFERLLSLVRRLAGNQKISLDTRVYLSEKETGNKNRALAYLLKAYGMIDCDVEAIVDLYFRACSIKASCRDLANIALIFAGHGVGRDGEIYFDRRYAKYINAILTICGMYDGSGDFALNVGIPAKSGVGGGIMAIVPGKMGIATYSPALDKKGNSVCGLEALKLLSEELSLSVF